MLRGAARRTRKVRPDLFPDGQSDVSARGPARAGFLSHRHGGQRVHVDARWRPRSRRDPVKRFDNRTRPFRGLETYCDRRTDTLLAPLKLAALLSWIASMRVRILAGILFVQPIIASVPPTLAGLPAMSRSVWRFTPWAGLAPRRSISGRKARQAGTSE